MRYAAETSVPVSKSRAELETTVGRYGATTFASALAGNKAQVMFELKGWRVLFSLPLPDRAEFLAHIVLPGAKGSTAGAWLIPQLEAAYKSGKLPPPQGVAARAGAPGAEGKGGGVKLEVEIRLSPAQLAAAFAESDDEQQAQFFIELARIVDGWPEGVGKMMQWFMVGRHLRDCECSTPAAREIIREIQMGLEETGNG